MLHAVYDPKKDYNLNYNYVIAYNVVSRQAGFGFTKIHLTSIPLIDTAYPSAKFFTVTSTDYVNFSINVENNAGAPTSYNSVPLTQANCSYTTQVLTEPIVILNKYTKIQINYSSIVNGNPVSGLVFEGYYRFLSNNNLVEGFYSSSDLSTNRSKFKTIEYTMFLK